MAKRKCGLGVMFDDADVINNRTYASYYYRLIELAVDRYQWEGLPPSVDERFLELTLLADGMAIFFWDDILDFLALQVRIGGPLNVYRVPIRRVAYAVTGYQKTLDPSNSVIIFNNYLRQSSVPYIRDYAWRLTEIQRAIDTNVKGQKTPYILGATQQQQLSIRNAYKQLQDNEVAIVVDKAFTPDQLQVYNTPAPYVAGDLQELKTKIWNEALTYLGIDSVSVEKKERIIQDELDASLGAVEAQRYVGLNARRQAADEINRLFGLDVKVHFRHEKTETPEVTPDEQVHNSDSLAGGDQL